MNPIRQGDVLLFPIKAIPKGENIPHQGSFTLALGEATGHHHTLYADAPESMTVRKHGGYHYVSLSVDTPLQHQEHGEIVVPKGNYVVGWETERDPFKDAMRKVQD